MADRYEQKSACLASAFIRLEQFQVFPATSQSKLLFPNLLGKLDAGDRYGRSLELLEPEHRQNPLFDSATSPMPPYQWAPVVALRLGLTRR
jgi:hypothetical protein